VDKVRAGRSEDISGFDPAALAVLA